MVIESVTVSGVAGGDWGQAVASLCDGLFARAIAERNRIGEDGGPLPPLMSEDAFHRWHIAVAELRRYLLGLEMAAAAGLMLSVEIKDAGTNDGGGLNLTARFLS